MVASQVHLVRHGEVFNPDGILYGRLSGFGLSKLGHRMAQAAADELVSRGRPVTAIRISPLQRTRESAAPIAAAFGRERAVDERLIEPANRFEGTVMRRALRKPVNWPYLVNPLRPSWGEPYTSIEKRMREAIEDAFDSVESGDVVLVSHQLPIWVAHLSVVGARFPHDPRNRRCSLSSVTTFEYTTVEAGDAEGLPGSANVGPGGRLVEVAYVEPAARLGSAATDVGAV
ncbi:phosphoglycerate mutase [Leifsonia xyli subsp. xyli]|uniref:Phosphoglycerate mutase n=2 Tax=Leifsonia xyli subsp. xyli TaxID=59736 RepID=Q6AHD5_LEIXX|nr:histidine phosphatase family protein [Leifsonia xyli]AAT88210.1 phosphoglycerate mutase [Leifsonia xyli subsp. xyli str. CTCB07]ODA90909.1 phosphoglycerate mutase [Leifsonia xyli subsp. xyli]